MMRTSEARFRALLDHAADMIVAVDGSGRLGYISPSCPHILGWEITSELIGKSLHDLLEPDERATVQSAIDSLPAPSALPSKIRFRLLHQDRTYRLFQAIVSRLPSSYGAVGVLINARDVTEEIRLQE